MRLNASALNSRSLNVDRRTLIQGSGDAALSITPALLGTRYVHGSGNVVSLLTGSFQASAQRFAQADWLYKRSTELDPSVYRSATGALQLGLDSSLYYTRTVQGFGSAELGLLLFGDVGVVFGEGQAVFEAFNPALDGAKSIRGEGAGIISVQGSLAPSAIRRGTGAIATNFTGEGEGSHIDALGTRYIGFGADAQLNLLAQDAGMLRQAFLGSMDMGIQGALQGSSRKPTLAGAAVTRLLLSGDFRVIRRGEGSLLVPLRAALDGSIYVRGEGSAIIQVRASGTGSKRTFPLLNATLITLTPAMAGVRKLTGLGAAQVGVFIELDALRKLHAEGDAIFEVLGESEGFLNPYSEDIPGQTFFRPAVDREFIRPAVEREWRRQ